MIDYFEVYTISDQTTTCPKCVSRTKIILDLFLSLEQSQQHKCLSIEYNFEFVMQNEILECINDKNFV